MTRSLIHVIAASHACPTSISAVNTQTFDERGESMGRKVSRAMVVLTLLTVVVIAGRAEEPDIRPAKSPYAREYDYGKATAQEPHYENKALWFALSGEEYYIKTTWPKVRCLVWNKPGESGFSRALDPLDLANWTDTTTGQPADEFPDENTDVILPAAEKDYEVDWVDPGHGHTKQRLRARCVTLGKNVNFRVGGALVTGNVWVQRNGSLCADGTLNFAGANNVFYRNDNDSSLVRIRPVGWTVNANYMCQYANFAKANDATVEILGQVFSMDEFQVEKGGLIVAPDSIVEMGREAYPYINKGARVVLLDNAYFAKFQIDFYACDLQINGGTLQAGLPERPLRRDAHFRLGKKNYSSGVWENPSAKNEDQQVMKGYMRAREIGMVLHAGSAIRTISTDIRKAKLVISALPDSYEITYLRPALNSKEFAEKASDPTHKALFDWLDKLPRGIDIAVCKGATIEGVEFNGLHVGGLMLEDPDARKGWKDVTFGPANLAPEKSLVAPMPPSLASGKAY